jgi:arginyl-tRNA synthetase
MFSDLIFSPCVDEVENLKALLIAGFYDCNVVISTESGTVQPSFAVATIGDKTVFGSNNICRMFYSKCVTSNATSCILDNVLDLEEYAVCSFTRSKQKKKTPAGIITQLKASLEILGAALATLKNDEPRAYEFACLVVFPSLRKLGALVKEPLLPEPLTAAMQKCTEYASLLSFVETKLKAFQSGPVVEAVSLGPLPVVEVDILSDGLVNSLRKLFSNALRHAIPLASSLSTPESDSSEAVITRCANAKFGDFQCNNAMKLSKLLKSCPAHAGSAAPKDLANAIVNSLPVNDLISEASVMPNGFINIRVASSILISTLAGIVTQGVRPPVMEKKRVLVDFSSPNIAKEMHVGHLRSTIIGDSLCRMLEFCGHDVHRINHVGDWGTQFGMLISYLQEAYPDILVTPPNITDLTKIYKAAKERFDVDEDFKTRSRNNVVKLQGGDAACAAIWNLLCDISRREFQRVYDALDVTLTEVGESYYNTMIPPVLDELTSRGLTETEDKLLLSRLPHFDIPLILRKSDGGYGYDSTDMAAINYRLKSLDRDWLIYITDAGQMGHFHKVFDVAKSAGWADAGQRLDFIGFGVVCGEDGKRFKTRSGDTVRLIDLLDAAKERMEKSLQLRQEEGKTSLSDEAITSAASTIGYGAVKYFDLKQNPITNYIFNYDRMLDTKGDTAVYLLFAYARVASILRKGLEEKGFDAHSLSAQELEATISLDDPAERALAFELLQFGEVLRTTLNELMPNKLCEYLKEVSVKLTDFVTKCHVLNSKETSSRLILCESTRLVLAKLFSLLGIGTLEQI